MKNASLENLAGLFDRKSDLELREAELLKGVLPGIIPDIYKPEDIIGIGTARCLIPKEIRFECRETLDGYCLNEIYLTLRGEAEGKDPKLGQKYALLSEAARHPLSSLSKNLEIKEDGEFSLGNIRSRNFWPEPVFYDLGGSKSEKSDKRMVVIYLNNYAFI